MPSSEDHDTERKVRIEQESTRSGNGTSKNGRTSAPFLIEATTATRGENSVEKSLEDFIARANSTFLEADGWDLSAEDARKPAKVDAKSTDAKPTEAKPGEARKADAKPGAGAKAVTPIAAVEKTEIVKRDAAPPKVVVKQSVTGMVVAFIGGAAIVFGVMKMGHNDKASPGQAPSTSAAALPGTVDKAAPEPTAVEVAPAPVAPTAVEVAPTPAPSEPVIQPMDPAAVTPPAVEAKKADAAKKAEPKKVDKAEPKKVEAKGTLADPFSATPAPAEPKKPVKKKGAAPKKGGIVDPFAM